MKCGRCSEDCCKEAKFEVDVYAVKRVDKGRFYRYERSKMLSKLFFCEDHAVPFYQDKLNYEITELDWQAPPLEEYWRGQKQWAKQRKAGSTRSVTVQLVQE